LEIAARAPRVVFEGNIFPKSDLAVERCHILTRAGTSVREKVTGHVFLSSGRNAPSTFPITTVNDKLCA